jgi:two-component system, OmpR family, phosphate regulon response regulator PhoB
MDAMQDTVLVIEDEADMMNLLRYNLSKAGFGVLIARDGLTGLELARKNRPDVVILDLLLPQMDGYAVCKAIRNNPATVALPVVILTAKAEPGERIKGLEIGADDYVTKPFNLRELILRVRALLRRSSDNAKIEVLEAGAFQVNRNKFEIQLEGRRLDLTTIEFKLLTLLIERRGRIQSREGLLYDVWGYQNPMDTRTVDTHICRLREKLGEHAERLEIRSQGCRFDNVLKPLPADLVPGETALLTNCS